MIASLDGLVAHLALDSVTLLVGGVGYRVHTTPAALASLRHGAEALLHTSLVVREDSMTLFGFVDADERDVFEVLMSVSGVGPRLALAMLAVHAPDAIRSAVAAEDTKALTRVPGIGDKGARRIVLELSGKLGATLGTAPAPSAPVPESAARADVVAALQGLGWAVKQAETATDAVLAADGAPSDVGALLRAALQRLGGSRD